MDKIETWDRRFLTMAALVASWSKDPSTQCGAVVVRPDKTVVSVGFNGLPRQVEDRPEILHDREAKYARVVHAEMNALLAAREPLTGYTMYTWPPGHGPSCERCAAHIIQAGISRVVYIKTDKTDFGSRWAASCLCGLEQFREAGVEVVGYTEGLG